MWYSYSIHTNSATTNALFVLPKSSFAYFSSLFSLSLFLSLSLALSLTLFLSRFLCLPWTFARIFASSIYGLTPKSRWGRSSEHPSVIQFAPATNLSISSPIQLWYRAFLSTVADLSFFSGHSLFGKWHRYIVVAVIVVVSLKALSLVFVDDIVGAIVWVRVVATVRVEYGVKSIGIGGCGFAAIKFWIINAWTDTKECLKMI